LPGSPSEVYASKGLLEVVVYLDNRGPRIDLALQILKAVLDCVGKRLVREARDAGSPMGLSSKV
jgi:hypothetical protein